MWDAGRIIARSAGHFQSSLLPPAPGGLPSAPSKRWEGWETVAQRGREAP